MTGKECLQEVNFVLLIIEQTQAELAFCRKGISKGLKFHERVVELKKDIECLTAFKNAVIKEIQKIKNPLYRDILYKHYCEDKDLKTVSIEIKKPYEYTRYYLHPAAINEFEKIHDTALVFDRGIESY